MSILVYTESEGQKFKKAAFEVVSYAKEVAAMLGTTVTAVSINGGDSSELGAYGVDKVLEIKNDKLSTFNAKAYADAIKTSSSTRRRKSCCGEFYSR